MKRKWLLLLILFNTFCYSQIDFTEELIVGNAFSTTLPIRSIATDVDNDGDLDIIVGGSELNWYENIDGLGNFGLKKTIVEGYSSSIYAADFDGDGDVDILRAETNKSHFIWYENVNGLGDFQLREKIVLSGSPSSIPIFPADIDNDGDIDIVCSYYESPNTEVIWFENLDGNGNFSSKKLIISLSNTLGTIYASDLDGDNDNDIIISTSSSDNISWLENLGNNGTFGLEQIITTNADDVKSIFTADIDNDGDIDILSASEDDNKIAWYENINNNGSFSSEKIISTNILFPKSVYATDIDNDGDIDVVAAASRTTSATTILSDSKVVLYENIDGLGNFSSEKIITTKVIGVENVICQDIDNDGYIDVISSSPKDHKVAWYKNINGNGDFGSQKTITRKIQNADEVYASDLDGDGDVDIISISNAESKIAWYENVDGNGFFGSQQTIIEKVDNATGRPAISLKDIDNDGDVDIVAYIPSGNQISKKFIWFENNGTGLFNVEHFINDSDFFSYIRSTDIDGDGDNDIITGISSGQVAWFENLDSQGTFGLKQIIISGGSSLNNIEVSDLDNDGDVDIACAYDSRIQWYENTDGIGNFAKHELSNIDETGDITIIDMDGDNDMDIVAAFGSNNGLSWYENTESDRFGVRHVISTDINVEGIRVKVADVDNDGDMDVFVGGEFDPGGNNPRTGTISWFENLGGLDNFSVKQAIDEYPQQPTQSIYLADIDGDNDLDCLVSFGELYLSSKSKISLYKNGSSTLSMDKTYNSFFTIHPNPSSNLISINSKDSIRKINIYDLNGRQLKNISFLDDTIYSKQLDLSNLPKGLFFIEVQTNKGKQWRKFIKN